MLDAIFLISTIDFGSKITGCKTKRNDVMEVYANFIIEYAVRTIYSPSVYLYFPYDYVCVPPEKQVLFYNLCYLIKYS